MEAIVTAHDRAALRMLPQRDQPHLASSVPRLRPRIASSGTAPAIAVCYGVRMSKRQDQMIAGFTTGERDYIRRQLDSSSQRYRVWPKVFTSRPGAAAPMPEAEAAADSQGVDRAWPHAA